MGWTCLTSTEPVALAGAAAVFAAAAASPPAAMLALATDPDPTIRDRALAELATWPDDPTPVADAELPADRLERLAGCHLAWVRVGVAANPGTGHTALVDLVSDDDPMVAAALAARFDLAPDLLVLLARNPDPTVQAELARNPAATFLTQRTTLPDGATGATAPTHPDEPLLDPTLITAAHPVGVGSDDGTNRVAAGAAAVAARDLQGPEVPPITTAAAAAPAPTRLPRRALGVLGAAAAVVLLAVGGYAAVTTLGTDPAPTACGVRDGAVERDEPAHRPRRAPPTPPATSRPGSRTPSSGRRWPPRT